MKLLNKIKVMLVLGTRPEVIKMAVLAHTLRANKEFEVILVNTGQHKELVQQMLKVFGLEADHDLALMTGGQSPASLYARAMEGVGQVIRQEQPKWVLVQGDTGTAAAAAMAAFYERVPVAHVEAGLRTHDLMSPWPEEYNRRSIALSASLHFAPTESAKENLLAEKIDSARIVLTGNTGIDALLWMVERLRGDEGQEFVQRWGCLLHKPFLLCTFHRREAFGDGLLGILEAVADLVRSGEVQCVLPLHPNPKVQEAAHSVFADKPNGLFLTTPLDYKEFVWLMDRATLLLTDSGGVQEEAPTLGKPVVVTRDKTERPEAVSAGSSVLAGMEKSNVLVQVRRILQNKDVMDSMAVPRPVYGDGKASVRIAEALLRSEGAGVS